MKYTVTDEENHYVSVAKGSTAPTGVLSIQEKVTNPNDGLEYSVTSIGEYAFEGCSDLTSVIIPNSVTSIRFQAFRFCTGLATVTIPNSVTGIGYDAFNYCSSLTTVTIPNSVTSIGNYVFSGCSKATLYCECEETSNPSGWSSNWDAQTKWGCKVVSVDKYGVQGVIGEITGKNYELIDDNGALWFLSDAVDPMVTITYEPCIGYHWGEGAGEKRNTRLPIIITEPVTESKTYWSNAEAVRCRDMSLIVTEVAIPATCTEPGRTAGKYCPICNAVLEGLEVIPALGHAYDTVSFAPTCTNLGYKELTCTRCSDVIYSDTVAATGHNYSNIVTTPTCTAVGYTTHTCSVCEYTYNSDTIDANGHTYSTTITAPTCTAVGFTTHTCSVCEYAYNSDTVAANGHTEVVDAAVPATCTIAGKTEGKHCSVCNEIIVAQTEIPALGHEFKDYVYNNDATTTADGTETATCTRGCGATDTRPAAGTKLAETPEKGTAVAESAANAVTIYAHHNIIVVENATEEISVYNAMGTLIRRDATPCVRAEINVNAPGVYIVKTGSVVKRVMVN